MTRLKRSSLKKTGVIGARKPIKKAGKKTKEWAEARKEVIEYLADQSVTSCELAYEGCLGSSFLTLAHSLRRRKISSKEELKTVILACTHCHYILDGKPQKETEAIVIETIKNRK